MNLDLFYENSNVEGKRYPNELLFSEKMEYSGDLYYRTRRVNEIAEIMYLINNKLKAIKKGKRLLKIFCPVTGSVVVRISNKFIADLQRMAELDIKMTEYDELGKLLKLRKKREPLVPKVVDKKKKIRAKRKSRKVILKKWAINITDD